jgi:membrane-associated protease RseP (regulator of RpoE activity)
MKRNLAGMRASPTFSRTAGILAVLVCLSLSASLAACVTTEDVDPELAVRVEALRREALASTLEKERRIFRIGEKLRRSGVDLCPEERRLIWGVITATERELVSLGLATWKSRRHTARDVEILWVEPGSPADRAGLAVGDVIVSFDGQRLKKSTELYRRIHGEDRRTLSVSLRRGDTEHIVSMPLVLGCFAAAGLWLSDEVNAYKTPHGVYATAGLLRVATSDDELAVILGHEFGHGILKTKSKPHYEADADYIGLYLAARAGYDIEAGPGAWRRWAIRNPYGLTHSKNPRFRTHPHTQTRVLSLQATIREIREKQAAGLPLEPEVPE